MHIPKGKRVTEEEREWIRTMRKHGKDLRQIQKITGLSYRFVRETCMDTPQDHKAERKDMEQLYKEWDEVTGEIRRRYGLCTKRY